jgi:hypothetical protein
LIFCFKPILLSAYKLTLLIYGDNTAMLSLSADARKEEDHISTLPLDIYGVLRHRCQRHPERVRGGQDDGQKNKISSTNNKGQLSKEIEKMVQEEIENPSMLQ